MDYVLYIILGASVGILSGYFGIGGGFVLTPILLLMGLSPIVAIATSLLYTIGTSFSGIVAHFRMKNIQFKTGLMMAGAGLVATQVAHPLVLFLERMQLEDIVIPLLYILLAGYFSYSMLKKQVPKDTNQGGSRINWVAPLLIGFVAGFVSTTLGVGGGFIIVPLSITFLSLPPRTAVGTSLFAVLFIVTAGFITYSTSTKIDYVLGLTLIIGSVIGGQIGAYITKLYHDDEIKRFLGILYAFTVLNMGLKMIGLAYVGLAISLGYIVFLLVMFTIRTVHFFKTKKHETKGEMS
ncbi:sulfite exporter TauE/SafE family protein [Bacillus salitolerans]|uniref:Probable membrane transporter protein n=1 Tax=Bacillus salitolerans TaxID=1437434 RepID=A0ABW4LXR5_9BACI